MKAKLICMNGTETAGATCFILSRRSPRAKKCRHFWRTALAKQPQFKLGQQKTQAGWEQGGGLNEAEVTKLW